MQNPSRLSPKFDSGCPACKLPVFWPVVSPVLICQCPLFFFYYYSLVLLLPVADDFFFFFPLSDFLKHIWNSLFFCLFTPPRSPPLFSFSLSLHLSSYFLAPPPSSSSFFFSLLLPSSHLFSLSCRILRSPFAIRRFLLRFFLASFSFFFAGVILQVPGFSRLTSLIQPPLQITTHLLLRFLFAKKYLLKVDLL